MKFPQEDFLPYEESKDMKDLGFDGLETCFAQYTDGTLEPTDWDYPHAFVEIIPAPHYTQAFRWFREKYKLEYMIRNRPFEENEPRYQGTIIAPNNIKLTPYAHPENILHTSVYSNYEEAELDVIKKLIKIAKQWKTYME